MEASESRTAGMLSTVAEGTWKACVCGLVVSERGGRKDNGMAGGEE